MKIDEECINHNAMRLIADAITKPCETEEELPRLQTGIIAEIWGIVNMAEALKEVLKA